MISCAKPPAPPCTITSAASGPPVGISVDNEDWFIQQPSNSVNRLDQFHCEALSTRDMLKIQGRLGSLLLTKACAMMSFNDRHVPPPVVLVTPAIVPGTSPTPRS